MKIIKGQYKNCEIPCPLSARPVSAKFREAYFQIIEPFELMNFVDLFCGSGIMGIEFLSRYPQSKVYFVDNNLKTLKQLESILKKLSAHNYELIQANAFDFKRQISDVNLIFADPPFPNFNMEGILQSFLNIIPPGQASLISYKAPKKFASGRNYGDVKLQLGLIDEDRHISWKF